MRKLIFVTLTYMRKGQIQSLLTLNGSLPDTIPYQWLIVEDAMSKNTDLLDILKNRHITHLNIGPTRDKGNTQRNLAFQHIIEKRMRGILYQLDDDNLYHQDLWGELIKLPPMRVGIFAILLNNRVEKPLYNQRTGKFTKFDAGWCNDSWMTKVYGNRKFCVDMGSFAFDSKLLWTKKIEGWGYRGRKVADGSIYLRGGESELLEQLIDTPHSMIPIGKCCNQILMFHNKKNFPTHIPSQSYNANCRMFSVTVKS